MTDLVLRRVRSHGRARDSISARLWLDRALADVAESLPGVDRGATLIVRDLRHLRAPPPVRTGRGSHELAAWRAALRGELSALASEASRPARGQVPAAARAVLLADDAELLACLAADWVAGAAAERWWWRSLAGPSDVATFVVSAWRLRARAAPAALASLRRANRDVAFGLRLNPVDACAIADSVAREWGIPWLAQAALRTSAYEAPLGRLVEAPWREVLSDPDVGGLNPGSELLLGVALMIARAPATAAAAATRRSVLRWLDGLEVSAAPDAFPAGARPGRSRCVAEPIRRVGAGSVGGQSAPVVAATSESLHAANASRTAAADEAAAQRFDASSPAAADAAGTGARNAGLPAAAAAPAATSTTGSDPAPWAMAARPAAPAQTATAGQMARPAGHGSSPSFVAALPAAPPSDGPAAWTPPAARADSPPPLPEGGAGPSAVPAARVVPPRSATAPGGPSRASQSAQPSPAGSDPAAPPVQPSAPPRTISTELGGLFYLLGVAQYLGHYGDFTSPGRPGLALSPWDWLELVGARLLPSRGSGDPVWGLLSELAGRELGTQPGGGFRPPRSWRIAPGRLTALPATRRPWRWYVAHGRLIVRHPLGFPVIDVPAGIDPAAKLARELLRHPGATVIRDAERATAQRESGLDRWASWVAEYVAARNHAALGTSSRRGLARVLLRRRAVVRIDSDRVDVHLSLAELPVSVRAAGLDRDPGWIPAAGRVVAFHYD